MARKFLMSWEGPPNYRWVKMFDKKRLRVTCEDLGAPKTKEGSYLLANEWIRKKLTILQSESPYPKPLDSDDILKIAELHKLEKKIKWAKINKPSLANALEEQHKWAKKHWNDWTELDTSFEQTSQGIEILRLFGATIPDGSIPKEICKNLFGDEKVWTERFSREIYVPDDKTLGACLDRFIKQINTNQELATQKEISEKLKYFLKESFVITENIDASKIDEKKVGDFVEWLKSKKYEKGTHNKYLGFFRRFVEWLFTNNILDKMPRNIKSKDHRKKKQAGIVESFDGELSTINNLPHIQKTWVILGLNCGMTSVDIADTKWEQIDKINWTLTRKRVKTKNTTSAPVVTYKLWPETIELIKSLGTEKGLLFLTNKNTPYYELRKETDESGNEKIKKKDLLGSYWNKMSPRPRFTLGKLRSIGATIITEKPDLEIKASVYLGRAPKDIDEKHYKHLKESYLDPALTYLRERLFDNIKPSIAI